MANVPGHSESNSQVEAKRESGFLLKNGSNTCLLLPSAMWRKLKGFLSLNKMGDMQIIWLPNSLGCDFKNLLEYKNDNSCVETLNDI